MPQKEIAKSLQRSDGRERRSFGYQTVSRLPRRPPDCTEQETDRRQVFDADFVQVAPPPPVVAAAAAAPANANAEDLGREVASTVPQPEAPVTAAADPPKKPDDPLMVGSAERIWVRIEMTPKPPEQPSGPKGTTGTKIASIAKSKVKSSSSDTGLDDKNSEIRKAWLFGSVAIHQDPDKGQTKGKEASGEALYLDNRGGDGKTITYIYRASRTRRLLSSRPTPTSRGGKRDQDHHRCRHHRDESGN